MTRTALDHARAALDRLPVAVRRPIACVARRTLRALGAEGLLPPRDRVRRRRFEVVLPADPDGATRHVHLDVPASMYVGRVLQATTLADYEPYAVDAFLAALDVAGPGAVYDVGANLGLYALLAASVGDRPVHAFEPAPQAAAEARRIAAGAGLAVTVNELALGAAAGSATLYHSAASDSSSTLNPRFRSHTDRLDVPVETLDGYVARTGAVPAVIKIDTETTEPAVLAGARRTLREHRPWLLVEVLHNRSERQLAEVLAPHGYTAHRLDGPGPRPVLDPLVGDPAGMHLMVLLAPVQVPEAFWRSMNAWRARLLALAPQPAGLR